ncbi:MAG: DUF3108 domain-containing protein [Candidatus Omnitrophica bacterium]|nr:DUF3108 domain-containing protein [Candidatus Omnitrophota bacterium]
MRVFALVLGVVSVAAFPEPLCSEETKAHRVAVSTSAAKPHRQPILGERLGFHGWWFGIPIGRGWIEVKEIVEVEGRTAYHIEAQGHSNDVLSTFYPIHDEVHSYLDIETLQPLRFEKYQREGHYRADEVVTFNPARGTATYRSLLNGSVKEIPLPPAFQDLVSALYWFRAQPLHPDQTITLDLYTDEKIYQTQVFVKRPILLELLKRGTFPCFTIEPKASFKGLLVKRGRLWAYLTADERRIPLLVKTTTPWGPMSAVIDEDSLRAVGRAVGKR